MSSNDANEPPVAPPVKRRRLKGACDICRRQKVRCDSAEMPGNRCSNCVNFQSECTHSTTSKAKSGTKIKHDLFNTFRTAQDHIASILTGSPEYISGDPSAVYQVLVAVAQYARTLEEALTMTTATPSRALNDKLYLRSNALDATEASSGTDSDSDNEGLLVNTNLSEPMRQITRNISSNRFYGKSSAINFVKAVMDIKLEATGETMSNPQIRRPEFWNVRIWETPSEIIVPHMFPEPDLMQTLIDSFFSQINILVYLFHAPTFRSAVAAGLHLRDRKFGAVVLAICALGSKFSDDSRVFLEGANSEHSAGWKWFRQVRPIPTSFLISPSLYDLQLIGLSILYIASGSRPEECWYLVGIGLRMCHDVGAHRRIRSHSGNTVESEEYKRVFWVMVCSDTIMSSLLGRPRATGINDLDVALPVALEGEEPRLVVYGLLLVKMMEIWRRVQDAVYPIKRKDQSQAYQEVVVELDSALNQWVDSVPDNLRWDPHRKDLISLNQSACLYVTYYVQILLHRPFIPSRGDLPSLSFPSLSICANAARGCSHVMDVQSKRGAGPLYNPQIISALFDSAMVLLLNVFHRRPSADQSVQKCLNVLRVYERRWQVAGRDADIVTSMLDVGGAFSTAVSLKRSRSSEDIPSSEMDADASEEPRNIAGSNRVASSIQDEEIERLLFLPLHTEDLGRLPIYEPFDFDSIFQSGIFSESAESAIGDNKSTPFHDPLSHNPSLEGRIETNWDDWVAFTLDPSPS
ncbi:fungal-specific transcription factor domain-containing protein [Mycena maculata]|uniref:Fungal-specific transcription factor domain-containing protein n=1 Tax=Mycena maculata TaxID=230809 RepID=A0AAD7HVH3_9AGAR|nr:fungal-specific transcription factor domain-containing protein [Mycena maculata]